MDKKFKVGMYGGKFMPFHRGHLYCIEKAVEQCDEVYVLLFYGGDEELKILKETEDTSLNFMKRFETIKQVCNEKFGDKVKVKLIDITSCKYEDGREDWDLETPLVLDAMGIMDAVYSSEYSYGAYFERAYPWAVHVLVDPPREVWPISRNSDKKYEK